MDDFPGLLAQDFGFKPQGKSAPMAPPRTTTSSSAGIGSGHRSNSYYHSAKSAPIFDDHDRGRDEMLFSDVFGGGGPNKYSDQLPRSGSAAAASPSFDYDAIFKEQNAKSSSLPVFDKPVYDEDIFDGLPGVKSASPSTAAAAHSSAKFDDVFTSSVPSPKRSGSVGSGYSAFNNLFADLGKKEHGEQTKRPADKDASPAFDDLLQGFGRSSSPVVSRSTSESNRSHNPSSNLGSTASGVMDDPFASLNSTLKPPTSTSGLFADPLEEISKFSSSGSAKVDNLYSNKGVFDDLDPLENLGRSIPPVSTEIDKGGKDRDPLHSAGIGDTSSPDFPGHSEPVFNMPASSKSHRSDGQAASSPAHVNAGANDTNFIPRSENASEAYDDIWLTVSEIPLVTQPTTAPPPSRPPPPRPPRINKSRTGAFSSPNSRRTVHEYSSLSNSQSPISPRAERNSVMDELDDFAMGRARSTSNEHADFFSEDSDTSSADASAAAMKEAMDKAEAKFRQMREREYLKTVRSKEAGQVDQDIQDMQQRESRERQERIDHELQQREREEEEREQRKLEKEREREEKERERRRLEREREKARYAVERATREARERAAIEARARAERAAADKATAEARQRAERAAVQRAQAEARERAAAEARERAGKVAAEARERANAEAWEKEAAARSAALKAESDARTRAERAAVERAAAEARQRAAAAAARANQQRNDSSQKNEDDLESFFSSRASSAPRPRATNSQDPFFDSHGKGGPETAARTSVASTTNLRKASSATNFLDDLSSIFGAAAPSGEFQEVEGESEDRRRARMERQQRTQERAAKALAEKNQRDLQVQREQAERNRIGETLDVEIKRWSAGKETNLRALLSTLQYVLWPECGWQPVSLTDLITGASVKKAYRKATLCIHPDKVQQKGATLHQKYIAEKVFDLLKEAWNKFNSEELF